jgi:sugar lactone lactonase YvrE
MRTLTKPANVEVYCSEANGLGEGPIWSTAEQTLYWLDIARRTLHRRAPADTETKSWGLPDYPGCLAELSSGEIAVAMGDGIKRIDLKSSAIETLWTAPPRRPGTRFNDGKVDPLGRFWVGTMQNNFGPAGEAIAVERTDGALYRFDANGQAVTIEENVGIANTLAWSPDLKHFYFADSLAGQIYVYNFDADSGAVSNKRVFFAAPQDGAPDGSAMDVDGCLWNARWDGSALLRIAPDGRLDRRIDLPVLRPTSCCFGGPNLDILYVTSSAQGLSAAQLEQFPLSGAVFAIAGLAQGMPVPALARQSRQRQRLAQ